MTEPSSLRHRRAGLQRMPYGVTPPGKRLIRRNHCGTMVGGRPGKWPTV